MKQLLQVILFLSASIIFAQNSPYMRPELLIGKEVKVVHNTISEKKGYNDFYTAKKLFGSTYMPVDKYSTYTIKDSLYGKIFKVTAVEPYEKETKILVLQAPGMPELYYRYELPPFDQRYPFEVIGGLEFPEGFYCDYIETQIFSDGIKDYRANIAPGAFIGKHYWSEKKIDYVINTAEYIKSDGKDVTTAAILLEGDKKITREGLTIFPLPGSSGLWQYKYSFVLTPAEVELLKKHKIVGWRYGNVVSPFKDGKMVMGILDCLVKK